MRFIVAVLALAPALSAAQANVFSTCLHRETSSAQLGTLPTKILVASGVSQTPFSLLSDTSKPNESEKEHLAKWAEIYAGCVREDAPYRKTMHPEAASMVEATIAGTLSDAASLHSGELTYGQFNRGRMDRNQRLSSALTTLRQREESRAQAAQNADDQARRNAALQYLLNQQRQPTHQPIQAPQIPAPRPSVTTDCFRFGTQTTCTSR